MSNISLYLDQDNELKFNVSIEGSRPGTPRYRLVLEGNDLSYAFKGHQSAPGEVAFLVPAMKNVLKEGSYKADLEVMVDDRHFVPLSFDAQFEASVRVTAESVSRTAQKKVGVTASIVAATSSPAHRIVEDSPPAPVKSRDLSDSKTKIKDFIGEVDGKKITADDLRRILRSGGM